MGGEWVVGWGLRGAESGCVEFKNKILIKSGREPAYMFGLGILLEELGSMFYMTQYA